MGVFFLFVELDSEPADAAKTVGPAEVLVPDTCEYESSQTCGKTSEPQFPLRGEGRLLITQTEQQTHSDQRGFLA